MKFYVPFSRISYTLQYVSKLILYKQGNLSAKVKPENLLWLILKNINLLIVMLDMLCFF